VIKHIGLLKRKDGMSVGDFQRYWREVHGPIAANTPGLRRYIQSHAIAKVYDIYPQAYDGMVEAWFDDFAAYQAALASPEWRTSTEDGAHFIGSSARLVTSEVPIIDAYPSPRERTSFVKYAGLLTCKRGLSIEEMQEHWRTTHARLVVENLPGMLRYIQCHTLPEAYAMPTPPAYDGVPEAWFESLDTFPVRLGRPAAGPPTNPSSIDSASIFEQPIPAIICREVVILE
jgi:uncharacterized protein (TIGR02118 family)